MENTKKILPIVTIEDALNFNALEIARHIEKWKTFLSKQQFIKFLEKKDEIQEFVPEISLEETVFAVVYPIASCFADDFNRNLSYAENCALFQSSGYVILKINNKLTTTTYFCAWKQIVYSTTNKNLDFILSMYLPNSCLFSEESEIFNKIHLQMDFERNNDNNDNEHLIIDVNLSDYLRPFLDGKLKLRILLH